MLYRVHRTDGVNHTGLGMLAYRFHGAHTGFQVAQIVQCIENTENIDTVIGCFLDKLHRDIVGIMGITNQGLPSYQHLQPGLGDVAPYLPQSFPGILVEITDTHVKCSASPDFQGMISNLI